MKWSVLDPHAVQSAYYRSTARFNIAVAGRRSGKSELARRRLVRKASKYHSHPDGRMIITCPTRDQVKRLHWEKLRQLVPPSLIIRTYLTELIIRLVQNLEIRLVGLDKFERAEGEAFDHVLMDEIADTKADAFPLTIRPSLSTKGREGSCDIIGKPRGRNHVFDMWQAAEEKSDWARFTWESADILAPDEIIAAKRDLDEKTFDQEYRAKFVTFAGIAYYTFSREWNASHLLQYDPRKDIHLTLDFNVEPGVAAIIQRVTHPLFGELWGVVDEIWIPNDSTTLKVCDRFIAKYYTHPARVILHGDATGGARKTSQTMGDDWSIIDRKLRPIFGSRLSSYVAGSNPSERARVNAVNTAFRAADGVTTKLVICPVNAPMSIIDFEGVYAASDGSIDKKRSGKMRTHMSDAIGYFVEDMMPVTPTSSLTFYEV